jgi:hypothetical protein
MMAGRAADVFATGRASALAGMPSEADIAPLRQSWSAVLMLAVLDYWLAPVRSQRFRGARDWIFYSGDLAPNAFDNVTAFLGLDAGSTRAAIVRRRSEIKSGPEAAAAVLAQLDGRHAVDAGRLLMTFEEGDEA